MRAVDDLHAADEAQRQTRIRAAPGGRRRGAGVDGGAQLGDAASGAMAEIGRAHV